MNPEAESRGRRVAAWSFRALVTLLGGASLLVSVLFAALMAVFWGNFHFANGWHLFVACWTVVASSLSVGAFVRFAVSGDREAGMLSLFASGMSFGTILVWMAEPSSGLIH